MARFLKDFAATAGKAPGTPIFIGKKKTDTVSFDLISFNEASMEEKGNLVLDSLPSKDSKGGTQHWINVVGVHDVDTLLDIGDRYGIHGLALEGIANTGLRPRIVQYEDGIFIAFKMLSLKDQVARVQTEQVSLFLTGNVLISFQEEPGDVFEPVRERLRTSTGRIRRSGIAYLAHALLDIAFDQYIYSVENFGEEIEKLEERIINDPESEVLDQINSFKREINYLRKTIRPATELAMQFAKLESPLIKKGTRDYIKGLAANVTHANDVVEAYSSMLNDYLGVYHTAVTNKLNAVMKFLTIFSAIFIPLTFIAGIYGTNFKYIPELEWEYGYPVLWIVLITMGLGMIVYFKRKKWF